MAGEVRDSFRQAMSEMFMGEDSEDRSEDRGARMTPNPNRPTTAGGTGMNPGGVSPIPTSRTAPATRPTVPTGTAGVAAGGSTPNSAEVQFARMNQDMSGFKPGATASDGAVAPAGKSNTPLANSQGERSSYGGPMNKIADQNTPNRMAAVGGTGDRNRGGDNPTPPNSGANAALGAEAAQPRGAHRTSVIAEGTEISGEVKFGSNAEIYGTLSGKVVSDNDIVTNAGTINGDVIAKNLDMMNAKVTGDVATQGDLRLSDSSVLTGDIAAARMDLRGQVKGNAAVKRELNVHSSAKLEGDVEAGSIAIGHGARVRGFINVGTEEAEAAPAAKPAADSPKI